MQQRARIHEVVQLARLHLGLGIVLAQQCGLRVALLSGRRSAAVDRRAAELGIPGDLVLSGARDKEQALRALKERLGLGKEAVAFVGDDLNDLPAFGEAGLSVAVSDAAPELASLAHFVTSAKGGEGAAREIIERILSEQGRWEDAVQDYLAFLRRDPTETAPPSPQ